MEDQKEIYIEYLKSELDVYARYHYLKETMAWVVTAAYVPSVIVFSLKAVDVLPKGLLWDLLLSLVIIIFTLAIMMFVHMQFQARWNAADWNAGFRRAIAELIERRTGLTEEELKLPEDRTAKIHEKHWAQFIQYHYEEFQKERPRNFSRRDLQALFCFKWTLIDPRWRTELPSYALIVVASIFALVLTFV